MPGLDVGRHVAFSGLDGLDELPLVLEPLASQRTVIDQVPLVDNQDDPSARLQA